MKDERHLMFDLETFGLTPHAFICTIAAVRFNPITGAIGGVFERRIDLQAPQFNRVVDTATIEWWLGQGDDARGKLIDCEHTLEKSLDDLRDFIITQKSIKVWGNGATFDISILENAYKYNAPWELRNVRDMRTVLDLAKLKGYVKREFTGIKHSALDDAIYQAKVVSDCYDTLLSPTRSELL